MRPSKQAWAMLRAVDRNLFEIIAWHRCYRVLNIYQLSRLECDALHIRPFLVLAGYSGESQTLECPLVAQSGQSNRAHVCPLLDNSGQRWIFARDGLSAFDCRLNRSTQHFIVEGKDRECRTIGQ